MPIRIRNFIKIESSSGVFLFLMALLALIIDNTSLSHYYQALFATPITVAFGYLEVKKPILLWINDGFMTIFFLLIGLEIKRELIEGELNTVSKASLPLIAAIGGMLGPAAIYLCLNYHHPVAIKGWAIPIATDTAFSLAILSLLGNKVPVSLKIFLTALAIFDDIGAILVMAFFYSAHISLISLFVALLCIAVLFLLNLLDVQRLGLYIFVGMLLWLSVLKSGVHATLAGIVLGLLIPLRNKNNPQKSPLRLLESKLHPWVAFFILPLFAFANAGVSIAGLTWTHLFSAMPVGIALGLFVGKQLGIWSATMLAVKLNVAKLPDNITSMGLYGLSLIAGVGFTMSLFIGTLAFHSVEPYAIYVRVGVILGSILSGCLGYWILRMTYR